MKKNKKGKKEKKEKMEIGNTLIEEVDHYCDQLPCFICDSENNVLKNINKYLTIKIKNQRITPPESSDLFLNEDVEQLKAIFTEANLDHIIFHNNHHLILSRGQLQSKRNIVFQTLIYATVFR